MKTAKTSKQQFLSKLASLEWSATPENIGLMIALNAENGDGDAMPLLPCMHALDNSPMFLACVEHYGLDAKAIAALRRGLTGDDDTFDIRKFGARMFLAGKAAAKIADVDQSTAN
ncbi:hypothetical protein [Edaphobacter aggregans]|uniref:hypothetical protein n=1 Tax=Edaphobacter aggregans TaxID=570835 RepID=UPI0012FC3DA5|nr:hypothetical protein [Edaphobacter aggregans]